MNAERREHWENVHSEIRQAVVKKLTTKRSILLLSTLFGIGLVSYFDGDSNGTVSRIPAVDFMPKGDLSTQPACINSLGTNIGIDSTVGTDRCTEAFDVQKNERTKLRYSSFDYETSNGISRLCLSAEVDGNKISKYDTVVSFNNYCSEVLGTPTVYTGE